MLQKDIIFVKETWKDPRFQKIYAINGYDFAFAREKTSKGKGIGVFFKRDAQIEICEEEFYQFIKLKNQDMTVFCLYVLKDYVFSNLVESLKNNEFN